MAFWVIGILILCDNHYIHMGKQATSCMGMHICMAAYMHGYSYTEAYSYSYKT